MFIKFQFILGSLFFDKPILELHVTQVNPELTAIKYVAALSGVKVP